MNVTSGVGAAIRAERIRMGLPVADAATTLVEMPRGRPPIGPRFEIRLPEDLLAKVDAMAEKEGVKRVEMIRRLLMQVLG